MRTPTTRVPGSRVTSRPGTSINAALGAAIRERRRRARIHQDALADHAGLDRRVLSRLERGERAFRVAELDALAAALGVSMVTLFTDAQKRAADAGAAA